MPGINRRREPIAGLAHGPAGNALLKKTWPALQMITLDPNRITEITAAALVLLNLQRGTRRPRW